MEPGLIYYILKLYYVFEATVYLQIGNFLYNFDFGLN